MDDPGMRSDKVKVVEQVSSSANRDNRTDNDTENNKIVPYAQDGLTNQDEGPEMQAKMEEMESVLYSISFGQVE